jgi:hypothetical protein
MNLSMRYDVNAEAIPGMLADEEAVLRAMGNHATYDTSLQVGISIIN